MSQVVLAALALAVGWLAQLLLFGQAFGIGLPLTVAVLLAGAWFVRRPAYRLDPLDRWLAPAALVFAMMAALRTDASLIAFDVPAALALTIAAMSAFAGVSVSRATVLEASIVGARALAAIGSRAAAVVRQASPRLGRAAAILPVARGLLLAAPLLFVFATLFSAADAVFSRAIADLADFERWLEELGDLPGRTLFFIGAAWLAGGALDLVALGFGRDRLDPLRSAIAELPRPRPGVELVVALGALDALFLAFAALQVTYLFGGRDTLEVTAMTYSEYARRGFFELIAAGFLVGTIAFVIEWLPQPRPRTVVLAEVALLGLTFIVLASALFRLQLYQAAYGWSELRFYALGAIAWLGLSGAAAIALVAAGRGRWLPHAVLGAGLAVALITNVVGPQRFVAEENIRRFLDPAGIPADGFRGLDAWYLRSLGDDAVPAIAGALGRVPADERRILAWGLKARLAELDAGMWPTGWQSWNLARDRAREALLRARNEIERACPYPVQAVPVCFAD